MAISAAQISQSRDETGDNVTPYDVSDADMNLIYLDPSMGNLNLARTNVYILRRRRGIAVNAVDDTGNITGINSRNSQKLANIIANLAYWENVTGMAAGQVIGIGITSTSGGMQRRDQQSLNSIFSWQADAFVARVVTNDPQAIEAVTDGDVDEDDD